MGLKPLLLLFFVLLITMLAITLYPFNFFKPNGVKFLQNSPGIYFNGEGIMYTKRVFDITQREISIEILLTERKNSKNWGAREIFSIYAQQASPYVLIGQRGNKLFVYNRFAKGNSEKWYKQLFFNIPTKGKAYLLTVLINKNRRAVYVNGELRSEQAISLSDLEGTEFSGQFILGNSPDFKSGWMGEIRGLAVFNRVLSDEEISQHSSVASQGDISELAKAAGSIALFPFKKGEGRGVENIVDPGKPIFIPQYTHSIPNTIFHIPYKDMRLGSLIGPPLKDFVINIFFFLPFGMLISLIFYQNINVSFILIFLSAVLSGCILSFLIEFMQTFLISRTSAITDIISNTLGSAIGSLFAFYIRQDVRVDSISCTRRESLWD